MTEACKLAGLLLAVAVTMATAQQSIPTKPPVTAQPSTQKSQTVKPTTPKPEAAKPQTQTPGIKTPAQAPKANTAPAWKKYCAPEGDYCVKYPPNWEPLGDPAEAGGLVVAPPQPDKPAAQWSQVTVTATDLPEQPPGKERPSFDELIAVVLESMRPGVQPQTMERRQMDLDGMPAQVLKLRYDDEDGKTWIEEIALIDADDVIYSLALRSTSEELAKFEPTFQQMLGTWRMVEDKPPEQ